MSHLGDKRDGRQSIGICLVIVSAPALTAESIH